MIKIKVRRQEEAYLNEIKKEMDGCTIVEMESFGEDSFLQIVIPIASLMIPAIKDIVVKILEKDRLVEFEWDGVKIKGTKKEVKEFLDYIMKQKNKVSAQEEEETDAIEHS